MANIVTVAIVGCGSRGTGYSQFALKHPEALKVVAIAEPREAYRQDMVDMHQLKEGIFSTWQELAKVEKLADFVIIALQDRDHLEATKVFLKKGYHVLLEKPMAVTQAECLEIYDTAKAAGKIFGVCHVLRYTKFTQTVKEIVNSGKLGDIVSINCIEPVGHFHFAHSYVRGNWRNEAESSFMLLAKSCHDLDWIYYIMDSRCTQISSFGSLKHFSKENHPAQASDRCMTCEIEKKCPYSAQHIYLRKYPESYHGWPKDVVSPNPTKQNIISALETGPYGRCVYQSDNDVVDNQVVTMQFENGATANFTVVGCSEIGGRRVTLFGSKGELRSDSSKITLFDYLTETTEEIDLDLSGYDAGSGHGGGDYELMKHFVKAVESGDDSFILSGVEESLNSHLMVFAAEKSRLNGTIEKL